MLIMPLLLVLRWLRKDNGCFGVTIVALVFGGVIFLLLPCISGSRALARRMMCNNQFRQLAVALNSYSDAHNALPPAVLQSETLPARSWRTLLLPFIEHVDLAERYRGDEPWDSEANTSLLQERTWQYNCRASMAPPQFTSYVAVTGPDTLFPPDGGPRTFADVANPEVTAVLIELADSDIAWTEPRDVALDDLVSGRLPWSRTNNHPCRGTAFHTNARGTNVLFADGRARYLIGEPTPEQIACLFSIHSTELPRGMTLDADWLVVDGCRRPNRLSWGVLSVWLACLLAMLCHVYAPATIRQPAGCKYRPSVSTSF